MEKAIIVAVADNNAIGIHGDLPWHISEDLKYFKNTTRGYPVIMGRTTYLSIGRPLPGRKNIVLTHSDIHFEGTSCVNSFEEAFRESEGCEKCFIIGGASIYREAIHFVDKLYVTHVHTEVKGADAFFPEIDPEIWKEESRSETYTDGESGVKFEFSIYTRR